MTRAEAEKFKHLHAALEKMTAEGWDITKIVCRSFGFLEACKAFDQVVEAIKDVVSRHFKKDFGILVTADEMRSIEEALSKAKEAGVIK